MRPAVLALAAVGLISTACVGPATTVAAYRGKAVHATESAISELQTAIMASRAKLDGKLPDSYTEVLVSRSEQDLSDVQGQFDSIQPPDDPTADKIRSDLDNLLSKGLSDLSDLRIALRRSERADMGRLTGELAKSAAKLQSFDQELAP